MPILPNALEHLLLVRLNQLPALTLDYFAALAFRVPTVALRLGVFEALRKGPRSAADTARAIGSSPRGTSALLEALKALGYLRRDRSGRYSLAPSASKWLLADSPARLPDAVPFLEFAAFDLWSGLEQAVRTGEPPKPIYEYLEAHPDISAAFQAWTVSIALMIADEVAAKVRVGPDQRRLLDVGGGHGTYAIAFCRRYPALHATIMDLPTALESARGPIEDAGMSERISPRPGDFMTDDLGEGYDVVLLFNILHGLQPDQNQELIRRAADALRPDGVVVVLEQLRGRTAGPATAAIGRLLDLNYHLALGGRSYTGGEVRGWLTSAGLTDVKERRILQVGSTLIQARRP